MRIGLIRRAGCTVDDAGDDVVLPGLVDTRVHVHEPGQATPTTFERTTRAAAAGGVTSIIAMPFGSGLPVTTAAALESRCRAAHDQCFVDVGFWGGLVPGDERAPSALTEARARGYQLEQVVLWMCRAPAQFAGLARKGLVDVGYDADLIVFDADAEFIVDATKLCEGQGLTPYAGRRLRGVIRRTYLRGMRVYEAGRIFRDARGRFLLPRQRSPM